MDIIKLEHLNYIIEVARTGSMRQASKNLFLTQPTLSSAIKSIEEELGFNIFIRSRNGVELTPQGSEFIRYAKNIKNNMKHISNIGRNKIDNTPLKFNVSSQLFSYTLDTFFNFHSKYSNFHTEFKLEFCNCLDGIKNVYNKDCEIAFIYIHNDNNKSWYNLFNSYNMDFIPLSNSHLHVCVGTSHPLYDNTYIKLEDLYDSTLVLYDNYSESSLYKE
ncbi:MAG: LysR family transcriptional regulator, partial [Peptostreptococcaceae bacterium]